MASRKSCELVAGLRVYAGRSRMRLTIQRNARRRGLALITDRTASLPRNSSVEVARDLVTAATSSCRAAALLGLVAQQKTKPELGPSWVASVSLLRGCRVVGLWASESPWRFHAQLALWTWGDRGRLIMALK